MLKLKHNLTGALSTINVLQGKLSTINVLQGELSSLIKLDGSLAMPSIENLKDYFTYDDEYSVTPSIDDQTLKTKGFYMKKDLEIAAIPYYKVVNEKGGNTITIG